MSANLRAILKYKFEVGAVVFVLNLLLACTTLGTAQTWVRITPEFSTGDTTFPRWDCVFSTKLTGWITAVQFASDSMPGFNRFYKTTDGGAFWTLERDFVNRNVSYPFSSDSLHFWASVSGVGLVFTSDGGATWDSSHVEPWFDVIGGNLHFFDSLEGFARADRLMHTVDGGHTWSGDYSTDTLWAPSSDMFDFIDRRRGWVAGGHPIILDAGAISATTDSGRTWSMRAQTSWIVGLDMVDSLVGYAVSYNPFGPGSVYSTTDGWSTFAMTTIPGASGYNAIGFLDALHGWFVGNSGQIWYTSDGGLNWTLQESGVTVNLVRIIILHGQNTVYVIGENNTILRLDLTSDVQESLSDVPKSFSLSQNYPNPFNPLTTISYTLPAQSFVTLKVFNVLGQEIATLVNATETPGNKSVRFDGSGLPSGVYFYRLQAGSYSGTKMLMIVK
jgi:photosystem II stability/assembly factor-like uncharacterized protein